MTRRRIIPVAYGPDTWLLRFAEQPGEAAFQSIQAITRALEFNPPPGLREYVPGYTSVLVEFSPGTADIAKLTAHLQKQLGATVEPGPIKDIPVIYDGPDLPRVAEHTGLSIAEVCQRHAAALYRVALIGFAPGFPYLEGLEPALHTPRLDAPRPRVEAGSVAIGGSHTGIYSVPGPGGWNLIGRTDVRLFDPARATPGHEADMCYLQPGDRMRFVPSSHKYRATNNDPSHSLSPSPSPASGGGVRGSAGPARRAQDATKLRSRAQRGMGCKPTEGVLQPTPAAIANMPVLEILTPGLLATLQGAGRPGWRRFGIPPGGAMDRHALRLANHLLDNPPDAPVLECLQGARLVALEQVDIALAGAWGAKAWTAKPGETIDLPGNFDGVWHTLALPGGIRGDSFLGCVSVCARAGIGAALVKGDRLACQSAATGRLPDGIKCRRPAEPDHHYDDAPLRIWPGPQWDAFDPASREAFLSQAWRISQRSDRTGYRLEGAPLRPPPGNLTSEPVRVGSVQVPPDGQPIVTLHDGPTVGGYAKIALIDADDLDRLAQTRPGQTVRFRRDE